MLSQVDKAICLILDEREKERDRVAKEWFNKGINVEFFIAGNGNNTDLVYDRIDDPWLPRMYSNTTSYPTWRTRPSVYNAWKCHKEMMKRFLDSRGNTFLFLEDDSSIEPDFDEILDKTNEFFSTNHWDMIYLGCYHHQRDTKYGTIKSYTETDHPHVFKLRGSGGFHGVIVKRGILELMFNSLPLGPWDWMFGNRHEQMNAYAIYPCVVSQLSGWSHIEGCFLEKPGRDYKG